jgi:hypothetical protein
MKSKDLQPISRKHRTGLFLVALLALAASVLLCWVIWGKLSRDVWAYFTDEAGTRVEVQEDKARAVLWEDPLQNVFVEEIDPEAPEERDPVNQPGDRLEAAFSPDGTTMVLVRRVPDSGTDLFFSQWDGRTWSRPEAIAALNDAGNDRGPAFARDGKHLYFASDREGGQGGYDLYVSRKEGAHWGVPEALGETINTAANERGPAPSADGQRLFFSSDREGGREDIFAARVLTRTPANDLQPPAEDLEAPAEDLEAPAEAPGPPGLPRFAAAEPVGDLNSQADDVQVALTRRGDHVFLASDRARDRASGFDVYISRVVGGKELPPEKVDLYLEEGEATDPAVRMEGFDLLFSRAPEVVDHPPGDAPGAHLLYRSTTREVFPYTDLTRWEQFKELMSNIIWWILLALAALAALIYLLEHWRDITNLYHKCLAGSVAVHLVALLLMMIWLISKEFEAGGEPQAPEIAISIDALAQEDLALESTPDEAQISESPVALVTDKLESDFKIPRFEPKEHVETRPIVRNTSKTSLVTDIRPSRASTATTDEPVTRPEQISPLLTALPDTVLPEPESPHLDEHAPGESQQAEEPANPLADLFRPTDAIPQVETEKSAEKAEPVNKPVEATTETDQIEPGDATAETTDTRGEVVVAHRGLEADGQPPALDGAGTAAAMSLNLPGTDPQSDPLLPGKLETPQHELDPNAFTKMIRKQRGKPSLETIEHLGGSDATERAIGAALEWLSRNQEADGHWDTRKHGGKGDYDTASCGFALLCYYGWGLSHRSSGKYQHTIRRAIDWLIAQQKENGDLRGGGRMYCHGIAAIALCEAYGVTKDPALKEPAEKAIALIVASQSPDKGGWRYEPRPGDADTSVTGWQYMALHSARMAGIEVAESVFENARRWFDHAGGGLHGGLYGYTGPEKNKPAMVATGMFCRQLDLVPPTDPRMPESAAILKKRPINVRNPDYYYLYYGTLALYQHQGPIWMDWNERIKETLPLLQKKIGTEAGSWDQSAAHAASGGRVVSTTLATLSLEVYYRLLPMYGFRNVEALPPRKQKGN